MTTKMRTSKKEIAGGVVHEVPEDLRKALLADSEALALWQSLTPLARNEWICWVMSVKKPEKRKEHVERLRSQLKDGKRRPCCWIGCIHRTDKPISPSVQYILTRSAARAPDRSSPLDTLARTTPKASRRSR